jgi:hypothetical protein
MRILAHIAAMAGAASLLVQAAPASADKAEGWAKWMERAQRIEDALISTSSPQLDSACKGVTGTVIGQGFAFPYWGQGLIQVCQVGQAAYHGSENNRRSRQICGDLKRVARIMSESKPVAEAPGAHELSQKISATLIEVRDQLCVNFR